jgi:hypothetical protein
MLACRAPDLGRAELERKSRRAPEQSGRGSRMASMGLVPTGGVRACPPIATPETGHGRREGRKYSPLDRRVPHAVHGGTVA